MIEDDLVYEWEHAADGFLDGIDFRTWLVSQVTSLRAAVADRDAAIARAVREEREACARVAERIYGPWDTSMDITKNVRTWRETTAAAIRARNDKAAA